MKKIIFLTAFLGLVLSSCKKEDKTINDISTEEETSSAVFHTYSVNGKPFIVKQVGDKYYIADDIMISQRQLNIIKKIGSAPGGKVASVRNGISSDFIHKWTNNTFYYKISSSRSNEILQAFSMIEGRSSIKFVERTNEPDYVTFIDDSSYGTSYSTQVGMEAGTSKTIGLHPSQGIGTIVHETMHGLGYFHEHTRQDRNTYVNVNVSGLSPSQAYQYQIQPYSTSYGILDFNSIMMYPASNVMTKVGGGTWTAQRDDLSEGDIDGLNQFYGFKINGPSSICSDGIYTIANPGTVTLENADGIATLTSLGNNQWKVTRTGNYAGFVKLKTKNVKGYSVEKDIDVGAGFNISGRPIVNPGQIYTYTVDASLGNVSFFVGGGTILSTTANTVRVKVLNAQNGALPYFYISATAQTACGLSTVIEYPTVQE
jgi:hypothetical protein